MSEEFVTMRKGKEIIAVHPLVVNAHKALGWEVVEKEPVAEKPAEEVPARKPAGRKGA
jgi:hypothetical protein